MLFRSKVVSGCLAREKGVVASVRPIRPVRPVRVLLAPRVLTRRGVTEADRDRVRLAVSN
jgi:hypothetical protein